MNSDFISTKEEDDEIQIIHSSQALPEAEYSSLNQKIKVLIDKIPEADIISP